MNAISYRNILGALVVVAAAVLTGCAATGGAVTSGAPTALAAARVDNFSAPNGYTVCLGGHASRFKEFEQAGRVCLPGVSLREIY